MTRPYGRPPKTYRGNHCPDCGTAISKYSRGRCRECGGKARMRPMPDDFAQVLRGLGSQGAAAHYRASLGTITRWRRLVGLQPHHRAKLRSKPAPGAYNFRVGQAVMHIKRDYSRGGQAAEFLRKFGAVYRCRQTGAADPKGLFWSRYGRVLDEEQLISRATRLGWRGPL